MVVPLICGTDGLVREQGDIWKTRWGEMDVRDDWRLKYLPAAGITPSFSTQKDCQSLWGLSMTEYDNHDNDTALGLPDLRNHLTKITCSRQYRRTSLKY